MAEGCESCKKWEEHYYWNHFDAKGMHFFKIMIGDFCEKVSVPKKFMNHFKGDLSPIIDLKGPGGDTWHAGLAMDPDNTFLQSGWNDFVKDHCIKEHDLLVFKYTGNSCFEVLLFDGTGCEKASSYFVKSYDSRNQERTHKDIAQDEPPLSTPRNFRRANQNTASGFQDVESRCDKKATSKQDFFRPKKICGGTRKNLASSKGADLRIEQESDELQDENASFLISMMHPLTDEEKKQAIKFSWAIQPRKPFFISVIRRSSIYKRNTFAISRDFSRIHLPTKSQSMLLQTPGRKEKWAVTYLFYDKTSYFSGGWKSFALDNNLKEGDICIFQLAKGSKGLGTGGDILCAGAIPLSSSSVLDTEIRAVWEAVQKLEAWHSCTPIWVEGDSITAIRWLSAGDGEHFLIGDTLQRLRRFTHVRFSHIFREGNSVADRLANLAKCSFFPCFWGSVVPQSVSEAAMMDVSSCWLVRR